MLKTVIKIIIIFGFIKSAYAQEFRNVEYVRNYDGDTITVNILDDNMPAIFSKNMKVRVRDVDTAEMNSKSPCEKDLAKKAKYLVQDILTKGDSIILRNVGRGKYFRIVADVYVDDVNISDVLLEKGLGVRYGGGKKSHKFCRT